MSASIFYKGKIDFEIEIDWSKRLVQKKRWT